MKQIFTSLLLFFSLSSFALDANHFTITRITAPYFIVDGNSTSTITKAYVGFEVKNNSNSATTYSNLKLAITSIGTSVSGQNYSVVAPASGIINVGTLAPGETKVCYYYVSYPANVNPIGTFNLLLSDNTANSKTQSFNIRNRSTISANAGGTATQSFTNQDLIGGLIYDDVTYVVGNVQNNDESDFQVAVSSQFDPTKITLLSTQVTASSVPGIPVGTTDSLYFITGNGSNGSSITIRWTFRITGFNFTNYLLPCAGATSGSTNYKYALNSSLGSGSPITVSSSANPLTISKTSDKTLYGVNAASIFTITIGNPGAYGVTIDKVTDELPTGFTYQGIYTGSNVTAANSTSLPSTGATGTITFEGGVSSGGNASYYVPAGGSIVIKYTATTSSSQASNLLTTVRDYIGTTQAGSAQNTVSVSTTLPLELISFKASTEEKKVQLKWITTNEVSTDRFEVERSIDNNLFVKIGNVASGFNTSVQTNYSFIDLFPAAGTNYYRLKMVDIDGQYKYSPVVSAKLIELAFELGAVYPNPFIDKLKLTVQSGKDQQMHISLLDQNGHVLLQKSHQCYRGANIISLENLGKLPSGIYLLEIISNGNTIRRKLVKPD